MNIIVWFISILIVVSKYLDCWTTSSQIINQDEEQNPLARKLMHRYGTKKTIWIVFVITIIIVALSLWLLFSYYDDIFGKITFIVTGLFVSIIQFAVALTNKTRKENFITRLLMKKYNK